MFTGIIQETGTVKQTNRIEGGKELFIEASFAGETHLDESISVDGVCLTVVDFNDAGFRVQCVDETLRKTTLGGLAAGELVNLERSLTLNQAIEGHIVQGHVDTVGEIRSIQKAGADLLVTIGYPKEFQDYVVGRGSITVDGISLTVAESENSSFNVAIIPYTWNHTSLKSKEEGDSVNIEFDIFGKYIVRYLKNREQESEK